MRDVPDGIHYSLLNVVDAIELLNELSLDVINFYTAILCIYNIYITLSLIMYNYLSFHGWHNNSP